MRGYYNTIIVGSKEERNVQGSAKFLSRKAAELLQDFLSFLPQKTDMFHDHLLERVIMQT